jgi:hypothetical protein
VFTFKTRPITAIVGKRKMVVRIKVDSGMWKGDHPTEKLSKA